MENLLSSFDTLSKMEIFGIFAFFALLLGFIYTLIRMAMVKDLKDKYRAPQNRFKSEVREEEKQAFIEEIKKDMVPSFFVLASLVVIYLYWGTGF